MLDLEVSEHGGTPQAAAGRLVRTWSDDAGTAFARAFVAPPARRIEWPGTGTFEFVPPDRTVRLHLATADEPRARDTFVRIVQPIILQALGAECLHGSAVAGPDGVVLFAGTTGNGKSTLAWALGREPGFEQIADDSVVLTGFGDARPPTVTALPFRPRLRPASSEALEGPSPVHAATVSPRQPTSLPLRAIVVLEQDLGRTSAPEVAVLSASDAFTAVVTHAYTFDEDDLIERERVSRHYLELVERVRVVRLRYRPDFAALPRLLATVAAAVDTVPSGHA